MSKFRAERVGSCDRATLGERREVVTSCPSEHCVARALAAGLVLACLVSCRASDADLARRLEGTWTSDEQDGVRGEVTYSKDGTWHGRMLVRDPSGSVTSYRSNGTWAVEGGAIRNVGLHHDMEGLFDQDSPLVSVEKLVSVEETEYRYVCPFQGCVNTMRRVVK